MRRNRRGFGIVAAAVLWQGWGQQLAIGQLHAPNAELARPADLAMGKFLVARRGLSDPNFSATVVLLVQYDEPAVVGLIINRRTKVLLSEAFPKLKGTNGRSDAVYLGGPVEATGALALIRSSTKPANSKHVMADVYLTASQAKLEEALAAASASARLRVYVGYAGWTTEQLRREVELGGWYIFPGDAGAVFDAHPESVWSRWIFKTEGQIARAPRAYLPGSLLFPAAGHRQGQ